MSIVDEPVISDIYQECYGWNRQSWRLIGIAAIFCAAAFLPGMPLWATILDLAFFGGGAVMFAIISLRGTVAVRVDQAGLTLCASPLVPKSATRLFPWDDVVSVIIWRGTFSGRVNRLEYVGVERRPGAPPLTGPFVGRRNQSAARLESPGVPAEAAVTRAATNGWTLDHARLAAAVTRFAPGVRVLDATTGVIAGGRPAPE